MYIFSWIYSHIYIHICFIFVYEGKYAKSHGSYVEIPLAVEKASRNKISAGTSYATWKKKQLAVWKIDNRMELPISSAKKQNRISEPSTVG